MRERAQRISFALSVLGAIATFLVYWRTLQPTVSMWGDSAKFQYIAQIWGIPHPTGYPLYILLTRIFTWFPWGEIAYRVNLLSAISAALTIGVITTLGQMVTWNRLAALTAALMFAFSPVFWSQATVAEVYTLNALFFVLCLTLSFIWCRTGSHVWLNALILTYGLSLSHHASMVLLLPAIIYWVVQYKHQILWQRRTGLVLLAGLLLAALPYTYILVRASQGSAYSEFPPVAEHSLTALLGAFIEFVTGAQFRGSFLGVFMQGAPAIWERAQLACALTWQQFSWWGIALGLLGAVILGWRERTWAIGLGIALLMQVLFAMGYQIIDPEPYFIPTWLIWCIFISSGLKWLAVWSLQLRQYIAGVQHPVPLVVRRIGSVLSSSVWILMCLAMILWPLIYHWPMLDRSHDTSARQWAERFLDNLQPNALVVLPQPYFYSQKQVLLYMMLAEGIRSDVGFIPSREIDQWVGKRPVYLAVWMPEVAERYNLQTVDSSKVRLADYIANLPEGTIVVAAVKDEASRHLTDAAVAAWKLVGGRVDLRGCFRCAHGLIGVKGARPGSALEAYGTGPKVLSVPAGTEIGHTGTFSPVDITIHSAGLDAGDRGDIWIGRRQVSPQHRGYNLAIVDPHSGQVLDTLYADTFDTDLVNNVRKYLIVPHPSSSD